MFVIDRYRQLELEKKLYNLMDQSGIEALQLSRFNDVWDRALRRNPFYAEWARQHRLPGRLDSLSDLQNFPVISKPDIVDNQDLVFEGLPRSSAVVTGGSTGQPARFPAGKGEASASWASLYAARSWWDIKPTSRLILIWGHSHLYGSGMKRVVNRLVRGVKDSLTRTKRLDAYLISDEQAKHQLDEIIKFQPEYIIGYTSALERLARVASYAQRQSLAQIAFKGIIATAETSEPNGVGILQEAFSCPVIIEYGAAEFGVAAHSRYETWNLQTLWGSQILMRTDQDESVVTTLTDKPFPLVRYATGDIIRVKDELACGSIIALESIQGRKQDTVMVMKQNGIPTTISAIQPVHILKGEPEILGIQFEQVSQKSLVVHLKLTDPSSLERIRRNFYLAMNRDYPEISSSSVSIVETDEIELTMAGKAKLFRESSS